MKIRIMLFTFTLIYLAMITCPLHADDDFPMNQLNQVADGLNIEGGTIYQKYLRKEQIWSNLCIIEDRPFQDGIEWQELTNSNSFSLKEASIFDYNEAQVNFAYATLMHYYISHAHQITGKHVNQIAKVLIQVHRNTSGPRHVELLEQLLHHCYPNLEGIKQTCDGLSRSKYELTSYFFPRLNVKVDFCYGSAPENLGELGRYCETDIVLSFSLVAGLHSDWKSGSLLIPNQHVPFSLKTVSVALDRRYFVQNHLNEALLDIIRDQDDAVLQTINNSFYSLNPQKQSLQAKKLTLDDFKNATLLQVDGVFNPSRLPPTFKIDDKLYQYYHGTISGH